MSPVTHLAENEHVPDFAAFSVGSQLLLDFLWMTVGERERCHFSHSAVMVRHINWLSLGIRAHADTDTRVRKQ